MDPNLAAAAVDESAAASQPPKQLRVPDNCSPSPLEPQQALGAALGVVMVVAPDLLIYNAEQQLKLHGARQVARPQALQQETRAE